MDALLHPYGAEPTCHRHLFNFPKNRRSPNVSPSSNRCLDSAPLTTAWPTVSPPHHRLPTPIKCAPVSASPHRARCSPPFLTSATRAPSRRGTPAATLVHHRPAVRAIASLHHIINNHLFAILFYLFCSLTCFRFIDHRVESEPPENFHDINFEDLEQQQAGFEGKCP
jgi:hypothetical protein